MFMLYRKGDTHRVPTPDGEIRCEVVRVEEKDIEDFKKEGWTNNVEDLRTPKSEVKPEAAKKKTAKQEREEKVQEAVDESNSKLDAPVKKEVINAPVEPNGKDESQDPDHI